MQVFVVGATGVLGRWLVPLLVREGHRVRALVRTREKAQALVRLGAEPAPGDLLAPGVAKRLGEALAGCQAVVHAASAIPRDMAAAVVAALQSARPGSVFNVADEPLRHGDYVDRLALLIGAEPPRREPALPRLPSCRASSQAARAELGWTPEHSIWPGAGGARRTATAGTAASIQARTFE